MLLCSPLSRPGQFTPWELGGAYVNRHPRGRAVWCLRNHHVKDLQKKTIFFLLMHGTVEGEMHNESEWIKINHPRWPEMFQMAELGGRFYRGEVFFLFGFEISRGETRTQEKRGNVKNQAAVPAQRSYPLYE